MKINEIIKELKYIKKQVGNVTFKVFSSGQVGYYTPKTRNENKRGTYIVYNAKFVCVFIEDEE